ncbi:MAG: hypothetical protein ACRDLL_04225 [Solirubrobacterales bacterium]
MSDRDQNKASARETVLARVLGPGEPELSCEECFAQLDHYVELALADANPEERLPGMRAHLAGCPACAEDFRSLRDLVAVDRESES